MARSKPKVTEPVIVKRWKKVQPLTKKAVAQLGKKAPKKRAKKAAPLETIAREVLGETALKLREIQQPALLTTPCGTVTSVQTPDNIDVVVACIRFKGHIGPHIGHPLHHYIQWQEASDVGQ